MYDRVRAELTSTFSLGCDETEKDRRTAEKASNIIKRDREALYHLFIFYYFQNFY